MLYAFFSFGFSLQPSDSRTDRYIWFDYYFDYFSNLNPIIYPDKDSPNSRNTSNEINATGSSAHLALSPTSEKRISLNLNDLFFPFPGDSTKTGSPGDSTKTGNPGDSTKTGESGDSLTTVDQTDSLSLLPGDSTKQTTPDSTISITGDTTKTGQADSLLDGQTEPEDNEDEEDDIILEEVPPGFEGDTTKTEKDSLPKTDSLLLTDTTYINDTLVVIGSDTTHIDSLMQDTVQIDPRTLDSTARVKHFKVVRHDVPYLQVYQPKRSSFFVYPTKTKRIIEIDSTGEYVEVKEKTGDEETKVVLRLTMEQYLESMLDANRRRLWDDLAYDYELKSGTQELGQFISDITDFEIPLPSVGVLSIFGPPKISLKIGGSVDIHAAWRNESTEGVTASRLGNTRNEPDFRQQVQINVNGTIGDKLSISADWNTERTFEYENQLKIKYTGYEDEIIQSIEAGNVSLRTSPLVGGSEALFGIKAHFVMGPFSLTTLVSQKKGETKEKDVSSGTSSQEFEKRPYEYATAHYFLDSLYADPTLGLFENYYGSAQPQIDPQYEIVQIEVWKSIKTTGGTDLHREREVNAFIDLQPILQGQNYPDSLRNENDVTEIAGRVYKGRFVRLEEGIDYILHKYTGWITLTTSVADDEMIAVAFQRQNIPNDPNDDAIYGEFLGTDTSSADPNKRLVLKLVKPEYLIPSYDLAWSLQLKNIIPIGTRGLKKEGFKFDILFEQDGGEAQSQIGGVKLLEAFGLDLVDAANNPKPDGEFDWREGITIFPDRGEIIFPKLEPFGRDLDPNIPDADNKRYNAVYDTTQTAARQVKTKDKWIMKGESSGEVSSVYQLGFNVVENSVKVMLNGRELVEGVDYTVDYMIGQLTIRNDAALVPGANLKITYEENDLFAIASKTLFGARGILTLSEKTTIGFSALTLSQQTLSDKVRIGEEPLSNSIFGVDFSTSIDMPFMTRLLDNVISTKEMSTFSLSGEFAYMDPDPNTKKSTISSDGGRSIAYIDDFEGSKRTIPIGISYGSWKDLSIPVGLPQLDTIANDFDKMNYKAKAWWFNNLPSDVRVDDIWPERSVATGDEQVTVLDYVFLPDTFGTYNYNPDFSNPRNSWGGMMKLLSSTANNLVDENIEFIEFWLNLRTAPDSAKLYIDLGKISEDVIPNNELDTEDKNRNDLIEDGEDTGIDGIFDGDEQTEFGTGRGDPSGDNFNYVNTGNPTIFDYFTINGTQGNAALTDIGRLPDTEDLNKNGTINRINSFFRYEVPIDTTMEDNPFIVGGGDNEGWYQFRIPLKNAADSIGNPSLTQVEFVRVFSTDVDDTIHIRIADFNLVGNQWQKEDKEDSTLRISVVNIEDNPTYTSPPGVQRERDRSRPDQDIFKNEQSLNLIIDGLKRNESRQAVKYLYRPLDVFNYTEMKLFVHGDMNNGSGSVSEYVDEYNYASEVFFRFGTDTNNFYEYRQPVKSGWNEVAIVFNELTAIKQARDSVNQTYRVPLPDKEGHFYVVKGNPTLTSVKFLSVGIYHTNNAQLAPSVSGEVWINELRVVGADDTPGWAYTASTSIKFADLLSVNVNTSQTDPYFHKLPERFGSRVDQKNWSLNANLNVLKLIPVNLPGSNLTINYQRSESVQDPLFVPGTDIKVDEAQVLLADKLREEGVEEQDVQNQVSQLKTNAQTLSQSETWTLSNIKLNIPVDYWLIRDTWNSISFNFTYNTAFSRNPTTMSNQTWVWNAGMTYNLNLGNENYFMPADIPVAGSILAFFSDYRDAKIYFAPQSINAGITAKRNRSTSISRPTLISESQETISRDFTATRTFGLKWKLTEDALLNLDMSYNFNIQSTLAYLETDINDQQRPESEIWSDIFAEGFFGREFNYQQSFDLRSTPRLPSVMDINRYLTLTAGYNVKYNWKNDFRQEDLGRSASFSNRTSFSMKLRLKAIFDPIFETDEKEQQQEQREQRERKQPTDLPKKKKRYRDFSRDLENYQPPEREEEKEEGTGILEQEEEQVDDGRPGALSNALMLLKSAVKYLLFDYENINIDFTNDVSVGSGGLYGRHSGFSNFWGFGYDVQDGPSKMFMLGLDHDIGKRAPNGNLTDNFSESNSIKLKTSRPLWEDAKIDIDWKVDWSINKTTSLQTDSLSNVSISNVNANGKLTRSFIAFPDAFVFSIFGNGIKKVNELYDPEADDPAQSLNDAFIEGFETMPLLSSLPLFGDITKYIPRPNWRITWSGLEKLGLFSGFTKRVSLDHSYNSDYTEGWKLDPTGKKIVETQSVSYGFRPLLGLNVTFNELWEGNLSGSVKYSTSTRYSLTKSTNNIQESEQRDIGITINYSKSGFELPLFGINLKNDIEFSFSYTLGKNSDVLFDMNAFTEEGTPQNGTNTITIEPRIKYVISSRVTLQLFYKRVDTTPEGAARIPPTTRNEAGLDIRISIQ